MKSFVELSDMLQQKEDEKQRRQNAEDFAKKKAAQRDNAVICGIYRPEPVDRAAAMLLAKASWLSLPNVLNQETRREINAMEGKFQNRNDSKQEFLGPVDTTEAIVKVGGEPMYDMNKVAQCFIRHCEEKYPPKLTALARALLDANTVVDEELKKLGGIMDEFDRVTKTATQTIRAQRMITISETTCVMNALKDVRQFFLGSDYERETKRLGEFVELCERLQKLKDSGFLDTVADTMVRLASSAKQP